MRPKEYKHKIKDLIFEENLLLPDFQRNFVWKPQENQLKLICSLFLDIPIGSILVLDNLDDDIGLRDLCFQKGSKEKESSKLLMDGQQRVSTIKSVFSDLYDTKPAEWKQTHKNLYSELQFRWFLDLSLKGLPKEKLKNKLKLLYDFYWTGKFEDYDIEDIESIITNKKILVKNEDERWHPAQAQETDKLENYCSEGNFLPLFLVLSNPSALKSITEKISGKYIDFLLENKDQKVVKRHLESIRKKQNLNPENKQERQKIIDKIQTTSKDFFDNHIIHKEIYGVEYSKSQIK